MAFNLGSGLTGGLGGAASGATLGSIVPGLGTAVGGGLGGLLGLLGGGFGGGSSNQMAPNMMSQMNNDGLLGAQQKIPGYGTLARTSPYSGQQQQALQQLLQQALSGQGLSSGSEDLARKRFSERTVPGIAERFTSMGAGGGRSSAFGQQLGAAGADLEAQLGANRDQQLMQLLQLGLQPQYETAYLPEKPSAFGQAVGSFLGGKGGEASVNALVELLKYLTQGKSEAGGE